MDSDTDCDVRLVSLNVRLVDDDAVRDGAMLMLYDSLT